MRRQEGRQNYEKTRKTKLCDNLIFIANHIFFFCEEIARPKIQNVLLLL